MTKENYKKGMLHPKCFQRGILLRSQSIHPVEPWSPQNWNDKKPQGKVKQGFKKPVKFLYIEIVRPPGSLPDLVKTVNYNLNE